MINKLKLRRGLTIACLALSSALSPGDASGQPAQKQHVIIGYVTGWNWPGDGIEVEKLTHINYAFATVAENGELADLGVGDSNKLHSLTLLKAKNKDLKILISVGGWSGCKYFSDAALTDDSRRKFAASAVEFMKQHQLDGVDIDWEFPGQIGNDNHFRPEDKENFTLLLKALRERLDKEGKSDGKSYLLTIASGIDAAFVSHTDLGKAQQYLDYVNLMGYDIFNGNDKTTGHQSNLHQSTNGDHSRYSVDGAVKAQIAAGVPAAKIVLGVPFYGRGWTEVNSENNGLYQPSAGKHFEVAYDKLVDSYIGTNGFVRFWDDAAKAPYLWNSQSRTFITYADPEALTRKTDYIKSQALAGAMFWEYGQQLKQKKLLDALCQGLKKP